MKLKFILLVLLFPSLLRAGDFSGVSSAPMGPHDLGQGLSFSVIAVPPDNTLHWRIVRDKKVNTDGPDTVSSGDSTKPGEKYAYFWDQKTATLWFATPRTLLRMNLKNWISPQSHHRTTRYFKTYDDLPELFKAEIPGILE